MRFIEIENKDTLQQTPLHIAASRGDLAEASKLLSVSPLDLHKQDARGWTSVHYASANLDLAMLKLFLEYGANVNIGNNYPDPALRCTPLFLVAYYSQFDCHKSNSSIAEIMKILISKGAKINHHPLGYLGIFHYFAISFNDKAVEFLYKMKCSGKKKLDIKLFDVPEHQQAKYQLACQNTRIIIERRTLLAHIRKQGIFKENIKNHKNPLKSSLPNMP